MSLKQQISDRIDDVRSRRPVVDHVVRTVQHYGAAKGSIQAGAVTYFAFLSFFPILALAFAVIGWVSKVYPDARQNLLDAIDQVLPQLVGNDPGQVPLATIQDAAGTVAGIGLVAVLYSGLGWLSGMRDALVAVFEESKGEQPGLVAGKLRDLVSLVAIGVVLVASVAVSGLVSGFSDRLLELVGLGAGAKPVLYLLTLLVGLGANMVLFYVLFRLLADPRQPKRSLWSGALFGAVGFEVLKQLSQVLLKSAQNQPAFQAFGIALILLVWINYFSRLVMYAAAWAYTTPEARTLRDRAEAEEVARVAATRVDLTKPPEPLVGPEHGSRAPTFTTSTAFTAGGLTALGVVAVLTRRKKS